MSDRLVSVAVQVPRLAVDREFTYRLPTGVDARLGSLVQVPFHGRKVRGWVLGGADPHDAPARLADVRRVLSEVRFFDERLLELYRWLARRYVTPLAVVIDRAVPSRVVSEEARPIPAPEPAPRLPPPPAWLRLPPGESLVRPLPGEGTSAAVGAVGEVLAAGRDAIVVVPESEGGSHLAREIQREAGSAAVTFIGGEPRERYRTWLDVAGGRYRVVVGTRPAVFAPVPRLGLIWVDREAHAAHREPRSPSWHVRDVALARGGIEDARVVLAGLVPSAEAAAAGLPEVRPDRRSERRRWPLVETVRPGPEGRAPRLVQALRQSRSGFLLSSRAGYGVARVCRTCGAPAACARCAGVLEQRRGEVVCSVCGAEGACATCGGRDFGVQRRGAERVAEWAASLAPVPVMEAEGPPDGEEIAVGTPASVPDAGPRSLDLVAILDADRMLRRPGVAGPERAVATWFEAAAWAAPRPRGRVIVETANPGEAAVQALVRGSAERFVAEESKRRAEAGFAPGDAVFRVVCTPSVAEELEAMSPRHLLVSGVGDERVCLITVSPDAVDALGERLRERARSGEVRRVDAEPHL